MEQIIQFRWSSLEGTVSNTTAGIGITNYIIQNKKYILRLSSYESKPFKYIDDNFCRN